MKHLTPEAGMAYLYNDYSENADATRTEAESHLATCAECRQQLQHWRATLALLDEDHVGESSRPVALAGVVPPAAACAGGFRAGRTLWSWSLAAGVMIAAAFVAGRGSGPSRAEFQEELAKARVELAREIAVELRSAQQRDLAELATATLKASAVGQRELATTLVANFNEARLNDRQELLATLEGMDRRRAEEVGELREGFRALAEKTGGAFQETDTRLNALASALPVPDNDIP